MKKSILALFAIALIFGIYSCSEDGGTLEHKSDINNDALIIDFDSDEFIVDNVESNLIDATLENDMVLYPDSEEGDDDKDRGDKDDCGDKDKGDKDKGDKDRGDKDKDCDKRKNLHKKKGLFIGHILKKLNLTDDQKVEIRGYFMDYRRCVYRVMMASREARMNIVRKANERRREIVGMYKAGDISKKEAFIMLKKLNMRVRAALKGLIDVEAKCRCLRMLLANIRSSLTEREQIALFERWVASLDGPCFGRTGRE